eukprot:8565879-Ditylum_brightwellii.AAC.1
MDIVGCLIKKWIRYMDGKPLHSGEQIKKSKEGKENSAGAKEGAGEEKDHQLPDKGSNKHNAYNRRQQWYEKQDDSTWRWDSFNYASLKKPSGKSMAGARTTLSQLEKHGANQKKQQPIGSPGLDT